MFRRLDDQVLLSGQIAPENVAEVAGEGVTMIINNRADGEAPGQPLSAEIAAAAQAAGIAYRHIPIAGGFSAAQIDAMAEALSAGGGKILAFCTSGTRSCYLWALASARAGADVESIVQKAGAAGYDLSPLRPYLDSAG